MLYIYKKVFFFICLFPYWEHLFYPSESKKSRWPFAKRGVVSIFYHFVFPCTDLPFPTTNLGKNSFFTFWPLEKGSQQVSWTERCLSPPWDCLHISLQWRLAGWLQCSHCMWGTWKHSQCHCLPSLCLVAGEHPWHKHNSVHFSLPNTIPCLSIYENFYLLRYLNFLSVYCSAFKKLFTSVLTMFSP